MRVVLVHVRDPQFYAIPRRKTSRSGRLQVMGFPPIGIMSLSSVLKRAGHECFIFDQANPATPNEVIVSEIRRIKPHLVGLSFLSTTSYPYAKILAREVRAADSHVKIAFGGVFASLNAQLVKLQVPEVDFVCRGDGEQLILDLLERLRRPRDRRRRHVAKGRQYPAQRQPGPRAKPGPVAVPGSVQPAPRLRGVDAAGRPCGSLAGPLHDDANVPGMSVAVRLLRHPDFQRGKVALAQRRLRRAGDEGAAGRRLRGRVLRGRPLSPPAQADPGDLQRDRRQRHHDPVGMRGARRLGLPGPLPGHGQGALPDPDVRHRERQPEDARPAEEGADAPADRNGSEPGEGGGNRDRPWLLRRRHPG